LIFELRVLDLCIDPAVITPTYRMLPTLVSLLLRSLPRLKSLNNSIISVFRTHAKLKYNYRTKTRA